MVSFAALPSRAAAKPSVGSAGPGLKPDDHHLASVRGSGYQCVLMNTTTSLARRALLIAFVLLLPSVVWGQAPSRTVILSTTTSTQDSGLLDVLVPLFEKTTGYSVKTISVGTGQALALAARGEADVTLCHAPALEKKYVAEGKLHDRRLVMYNDFPVVGRSE